MAARRRKMIDEELESFIERNMRKLQFRVFQALISATPVATGFARAGWSPSTGAPAPGEATPPKNAEAARAQAQSVFSKHKQAAAALANGYVLAKGPIFIVNNVRYVRYLNEGTSAQAPAMFVEQAINTAVAATRRDIGR